MGELLAAVGQAWPRLLLYPGGLAAFGLAWLLGLWMQTAGGRRQDRALHRIESPPSCLIDIADALPPLLALTLLPIPPARSFPYGIDLVAALALIAWPRLRRHTASDALTGVGLRALLPGYGLLLLGATLMSAGAGSIELSRLLRGPDTALSWGLLLGGGGLWLLGHGRLYDGARGWAARLGELGHLWIGAMPILAALAAGTADRLPIGWAGWALPPVALIVAALILWAARRIAS